MSMSAGLLPSNTLIPWAIRTRPARMACVSLQVGDRDARLEGYSAQLALLRGQTEAYEGQLRDVRKEVRELAQVRRGQALP